MKIESRTRKAILGFAVFLMFTLAFGVYFFHFVEQRKEDLSRKNFRILAQVSENIVAKAGTYEQNSENVRNLLEKDTKLKDNIASTTNRDKRYIYTRDAFRTLQASGAINKNMDLDKTSHDGGTAEVTLRENSIARKVPVFNSTIIVRQDLQSFLSSLLWQDDFDNYLILNDSSKIVYQNGQIGIFKISVDSLVAIKGGNNSVRASSYKDVVLQGNDYKLFTYPFSINNQQRFVLIGLRSSKAFNEQSMHISSLTVVSVATLFFLLLLSFPFLKLLLISKTERLSRFDIIMSLISMFSITCLISLLTIDMFQYRKYSQQDIHKNLKKVSKSLESHLKEEMLSALNQIKYYDKIYSQLKPDQKSNKTKLLEDKEIAPELYRNFDFVYWIKSNGKQTYKWTVKQQTTSPIDVSSRKYFSKIVDKSGWSWINNDIDLFFLESIYSFNTGKSYAALSLPSQDSTSAVVAMTTELGSIFDPVLSHGYKFALINADGEVLFHSDKRRNLQENFLNDVGNSSAIISSISSRVFNIFSTSYHGEEYEACIEPLENWPVYLVTLYDKSYFKSANAEILSVCIVMLTIYGGLVLAIFLVIYASSHSPTKLHFRKTRLNWVIPHPFNSRLYQQSASYSLAVGILFTLFMVNIQNDLDFTYSRLLILTFLSPFYLICGNYFILNKPTKTKVFIKRKLPILMFCGASVVFINCFTIYLGIPPGKLIFFQLLLLIAYGLLRMYLYRWTFRLFKYPLDYKTAILTFLLSICLIPVFTFFKVSHDTEFRLYTKLVQLNYAKAVESIGPLKKGSLSKDDTSYLNMHPSPMVKFEQKSAADIEKDLTYEVMDKDPVFTKIYSKLRVVLSDRINETQYLNDTGIVGSNWTWIDGLNDVELVYNSARLKEPGKDPTFFSSISSYKPDLSKPINAVGLLLVCSMLVTLLYTLISFMFRKTVMSKKLQQSRALLLDIDLFGGALLGKKTEGKKDKNIFLIGLPSSGKTQFIHDRILRGKDDYHKIDLSELRDKTADDLWNDNAKSATTIILDHFEFGLHDEAIIEQKLILMENINIHGLSSIVAVSTVNPLDMIDSDTLQNMTGIDKQKADNLVERWVRVLGNFYTSNYTIAFSTIAYQEELEDLDGIKLIESECRYGSFLKYLEPELKKYASVNPVSNEEIILKIQSLATFYYFSLWKSCSPDEKYLLYDLAQDGLVNTRNIKVISSLVNKGLILPLGTLTLFNRSFRNFILSSINADEALALEAHVKTSSAWGIIRVPLILTLLALGLFVFYTQRQVFNNVLAVLATMAATLPMVLKLISSFQPPPKQQ